MYEKQINYYEKKKRDMVKAGFFCFFVFCFIWFSFNTFSLSEDVWGWMALITMVFTMVFLALFFVASDTCDTYKTKERREVEIKPYY